MITIVYAKVVNRRWWQPKYVDLRFETEGPLFFTGPVEVSMSRRWLRK